MAAVADRGPAGALIVFARTPRLGGVKTRLAASVGEEEALRVHRELLARTMAVAGAACRAAGGEGTAVELCLAGEDDAGECAALAARHGARLTRQEGGADLGARMHAALADALRAGRLPVLVGCDCPVLEPGDLLAALAALRETDAVFAPAEDGGYALVGVRRPAGWLFDGPRWGGAQVMDDTRALMRARGLRWTELRTLWDLDGDADYRRWLGLRHASAGHPPAQGGGA